MIVSKQSANTLLDFNQMVFDLSLALHKTTYSNSMERENCVNL